MQLISEILPGTRLRIGDDHPWAGEMGTAEEVETVVLLNKPGLRVLLDNGRSCYVFQPHQAQPVEATHP